ncbi:hypothetical protein AnigIFM56816_000980 [Aspergillus niger]|nr:hypothetical protein AnigIFM56816_000980 [Aspergillus niger]
MSTHPREQFSPAVRAVCPRVVQGRGGNMDVALQSRLKSMTQALRISATFPGLLRLLRKNGRRLTDIPSTRDRLDAEGITPDNKESWLALGIDAVIEGFSAGRKSGRSSRTWTRKKKATQYFPHLAPVATADRHPWVAAFQDLPTGEAFEHKGRTARASGIYINTTGTSSRGLTLTRAAHVILMETDWCSMNYKQVFGRCHRIGQRAKVVFAYVFQNTQIECEQLALRTWR